MQFKNPEFLYFLFLLIIPILIHLFQLRKFKKTEFTNVALLKILSIQSRKSSQIKKWLILSLRLLAITAFVLAFAQPFIPASNEATSQSYYSIYLDNSYSMQMPSKRGNLLKEAQQQLVELIPDNTKIHFFTNNSSFKNLDSKKFKKEVLSTNFTSKKLNFNNAIIKAQELNNQKKNNHKIILISDFQQQDITNFNDLLQDKSISFLQVKPEPKINFLISNLSFDENEKLLTIVIQASTTTTNQIPLSVYNANELLAKQEVSFQNSNVVTINISIENEILPYGKVEIKDDALQYDNEFYFSINKTPKINVWSINENNTSFLKRIFNTKEFNYQETNNNNVDYAKFANQNLVVINRLQQIGTPLQNSIKKFAEDGGTVAIIPSNEGDLKSYNTLLRNLNLPSYSNLSSNPQKITNINFNHPLLKNVFSKEVSNFEYPKVNTHYNIKTPNNAVLQLANQASFLVSSNIHYAFAADISTPNSNFTTSPLIVPIFYNMGRNSILKQNIFDFNHQVNQYNIPVELNNDNVIELIKGETRIIPQQQKFSNKVQINTAELNLEAGTYKVKANEQIIKYISFNHTREESNLEYFSFNDIKDAKVNTIEDFFKKEAQLNQIDEYWKALLIFALIFLLLEMIALRFIK